MEGGWEEYLACYKIVGPDEIYRGKINGKTMYARILIQLCGFIHNDEYVGIAPPVDENGRFRMCTIKSTKEAYEAFLAREGQEEPVISVQSSPQVSDDGPTLFDFLDN